MDDKENLVCSIIDLKDTGVFSAMVDEIIYKLREDQHDWRKATCEECGYLCEGVIDVDVKGWMTVGDQAPNRGCRKHNTRAAPHHLACSDYVPIKVDNK